MVVHFPIVKIARDSIRQIIMVHRPLLVSSWNLRRQRGVCREANTRAKGKFCIVVTSSLLYECISTAYRSIYCGPRCCPVVPISIVTKTQIDRFVLFIVNTEHRPWNLKNLWKPQHTCGLPLRRENRTTWFYHYSFGKYFETTNSICM